MADRSKIEWTDASWTPIRARHHHIRSDGSARERIGWHCEHVSPGCANCYAETINIRLGTGLRFRPDHAANGHVELFLDETMLAAPVRWRRPRRIFVCSMTDLFAGFVPEKMIDRVFAAMAAAERHTFQILTKRPARLAQICSRANHWVLPNAWFGTSIEDQRRAEERVPVLQDTWAAVRFLSIEPMLEAVRPNLAGIHWVICGGESGPGARPMNPNWARALRDQCAAAGVPFFMKQMARKAPIPPDLLIRQFPEPLT